MKGMSTILGIDPGLANLGWAVLTDHKSQNTDYKLVEYGVIETKHDLGFTKYDLRIKQISEELEKIIQKYQVTKVAYEKLYFARNSQSAMAVAEVIGVIKLLGAKSDIEVVGFTPLEVKMTLTGYGRAEKEQVELMVRQELGLEVIITPNHAADAAAVALTAGLRTR